MFKCESGVEKELKRVKESWKELRRVEESRKERISNLLGVDKVLKYSIPYSSRCSTVSPDGPGSNRPSDRWSNWPPWTNGPSIGPLWSHWPPGLTDSILFRKPLKDQSPRSTVRTVFRASVNFLVMPAHFPVRGRFDHNGPIDDHNGPIDRSVWPRMVHLTTNLLESPK